MTLFFTADHHFGHENIILFCERSFASVEEMDSEMVRLWNVRVEKGDVVYHLGDFTLGDAAIARGYFAQLNGIIRVLGNPWHHDARWLPPGMGRSGFKSASGAPVEILPPMTVLEFAEFGDGTYPKALILCHYPLAQWDRKHHGAWHLYGHSHGSYMGTGLCFDVGVDCNHFYPISLDDVVRRMEALDGTK